MHYGNVPLSQLPIPKGNWRWNQTFTDMEVAHYWHVWPPSRFYEASKEDQAIAAEFYREKMAIQAYQQELDAQESKRKIKGDAIDLLGDEPADG